MDFLTLITAVGFSSPSIPAPPPPPPAAAPPPVEEQEEAKARKKRLEKISSRRRGRQSLIASSSRGDTSVAPTFAPTLSGVLLDQQTLG